MKTSKLNPKYQIVWKHQVFVSLLTIDTVLVTDIIADQFRVNHFLDALASLDFKLSVSDICFSASASTGYFYWMNIFYWGNISFTGWSFFLLGEHFFNGWTFFWLGEHSFYRVNILYWTNIFLMGWTFFIWWTFFSSFIISRKFGSSLFIGNQWGLAPICSFSSSAFLGIKSVAKNCTHTLFKTWCWSFELFYIIIILLLLFIILSSSAFSE